MMIVRQDVCTERQNLPVPGQHEQVTLTHGGFGLSCHATMAEASVSVSGVTGRTASQSAPMKPVLRFLSLPSRPFVSPL